MYSQELRIVAVSDDSSVGLSPCGDAASVISVSVGQDYRSNRACIHRGQRRFVSTRHRRERRVNDDVAAAGHHEKRVALWHAHGGAAYDAGRLVKAAAEIDDSCRLRVRHVHVQCAESDNCHESLLHDASEAGFHGSTVPRFQGSRVPRFQGSRVPRVQASRVPRFQSSNARG